LVTDWSIRSLSRSQSGSGRPANRSAM
jgi:hypothetical protein